jgi:hypothetical protein
MPKTNDSKPGTAKPRKKTIRPLTLGPPHSRDLVFQDSHVFSGWGCAPACEKRVNPGLFRVRTSSHCVGIGLGGVAARRLATVFARNDKTNRVRLP